MKRLVAILACTALLFAMPGCATDDQAAEPAEVECNCGSPEADIDGCSCSQCLEGNGNPDNPQCICAGIQPEDKR